MVRKIDFLKGESRFQVKVAVQEQNLEKLLATGKFRQTLAVQFQDFTTPKDLWEQIVKTVLEDQSPLVISGLDNHPGWNTNLFDFDGIKAAFNFGKAGRSKIFLFYFWSCFSFANFYFYLFILLSGLVPCRNQRGGFDIIPTPSLEEFIQHIQEPGSGNYGKDLTCPRPWENFLKNILPPPLIYRGQNDLSKSLRCFSVVVG